VSPRAGLDGMAKRRKLLPLTGINPSRAARDRILVSTLTELLLPLTDSY